MSTPNLLESIGAGYLHKITAGTLTYPWETLATWRQTTKLSNFQLIKKALQQPRLCYRGFAREAFKMSTTPALTFPWLVHFPMLLEHLHVPPPLHGPLTGGSLAVVQGVLFTPVNKQIIRLQAGQTASCKGLWKGAGLNVMRILPSWVGFATIGPWSLTYFSNPYEAAAFTAVTNTALCMPFDYRFTRFSSAMTLDGKFWRGAGWRALSRSQQAALSLIFYSWLVKTDQH